MLTHKDIEELVQNTITELETEQYNNDLEIAHGNADSILCVFLNKLGFGNIVKEYDKIKKWYA